MENANPPRTLDQPTLLTALRAKVTQELNELDAISVYIDSLLENIDQCLNSFTQPPNKIDMDDLESNDESIDTPLISPFLDLDDDSDNGEVLSELDEYGNAGRFCHKKIINIFDGDYLAFQCMIGFRKFVAYFDPFLPMNIITWKAYNTIMVDGFEKDIGEFVLREMAKVVMKNPLEM
ncbi:hypothetical protein Tco_0127233 [Tanacetum coccineum]